MRARIPTAAMAALLLAACAAPSAMEPGPAPLMGDEPSVRFDAAHLDALVREVNAARTDPKAYADRLLTFRILFNGDRIQRPGRMTIQTREGPRAVDEAIAALDSQPPLRPLARSAALDRAAASHALDQGRTGAIGHDGSDGSRSADRIRPHGRFSATGEAIAYGSDRPEEVVMQLIVDDGVPDRGHRILLLNPDYTLVGVACAPHPTWRTVCVFNLARSS
jgi:uncharacterized protein YkwD